MAEIKLRNQPFDLSFHPSEAVVYASLLTGEVKAWRYDDDNGHTTKMWSVRPTKKTARALAIDETGKSLWMGGKSGVLCRLDAVTGAVVNEIEVAHNSPVNRICCVNQQLVASGDDEGVIKLWDPRKKAEHVRSYTHHWDYISGFSYFDDKRQLVSTSGDGHLGVIDIRSSKTEPLSYSEDQEDELLSITPIKDGSKVVVGTGLGVLEIWNRKLGWADCVDRFPGHPASVDAVVALNEDVVATGSEDGLVRVMHIMPNKFLGVIASHDEYPIERLVLDRNKKWLASVSHDEKIKLTDVEDLFESEGEEVEDEDMDEDEDSDDEAAPQGGEDEGNEDEDEAMEEDEEEEPAEAEPAPAGWDSDSDMEMAPKKKKNKKDKGPKIKGMDKEEEEAKGFFDDL